LCYKHFQGFHKSHYSIWQISTSSKSMWIRNRSLEFWYGVLIFRVQEFFGQGVKDTNENKLEILTPWFTLARRFTLEGNNQKSSSSSYVQVVPRVARSSKFFGQIGVGYLSIQNGIPFLTHRNFSTNRPVRGIYLTRKTPKKYRIFNRPFLGLCNWIDVYSFFLFVFESQKMYNFSYGTKLSEWSLDRHAGSRVNSFCGIFKQFKCHYSQIPSELGQFRFVELTERARKSQNVLLSWCEKDFSQREQQQKWKVGIRSKITFFLCGCINATFLEIRFQNVRMWGHYPLPSFMILLFWSSMTAEVEKWNAPFPMFQQIYQRRL